mgnify:CR=1 FL=1
MNSPSSKAQFEPGVITGKAVCMGGSLGRTSATGRGVITATLELLKRHNIKPEDATIAIQGFGNVGPGLLNAQPIEAEDCCPVRYLRRYL